MPLRQLWRLTCAARLDIAISAAGHPADLGRARRAPDARLRGLLWVRDRGCAVPGCGATRNVHAHHVRWWSQGGPTDLHNLVLLCGFHHHRVHEAGLIVEADGNGRFTFRDQASAEPRPPSQGLPDAPADALAAAVRAHLPERAERALQPPTYDGFGHDHELAVAVLADHLDRAAREPDQPSLLDAPAGAP